MNIHLRKFSHIIIWIDVVLYRYSTSNHNMLYCGQLRPVLSYIVILHQTTTQPLGLCTGTRLSYIVILHQTTTWRTCVSKLLSCLISLFYIKPQHVAGMPFVLARCLISLFYIKPQRGQFFRLDGKSCLISLFYIKPQPFFVLAAWVYVVLYRYSTSNHNRVSSAPASESLSYIVILHQTTTMTHRHVVLRRCLISLFYIKPQPALTDMFRLRGCLISLFYIKPQLVNSTSESRNVVLYRYSTSNHNWVTLRAKVKFVVLYRYSTSNHNI